MKKVICILLAVLMTLVLAACGSDAAKTDVKTNSDADLKAGASATEAVADTAANAAGDIDIDLTSMSSTMVYSEVQNMMITPVDYLGKTVKMNGALSIAEIGEKVYFACIIADATACCSQGIEFDLKGDYSYPEDYPEANTEITVTGTFTTYLEDGKTYCQLKDAEMQV